MQALSLTQDVGVRLTYGSNKCLSASACTYLPFLYALVISRNSGNYAVKQRQTIGSSPAFGAIPFRPIESAEISVYFAGDSMTPTYIVPPRPSHFYIRDRVAAVVAETTGRPREKLPD